jgi:hypothetical protein
MGRDVEGGWGRVARGFDLGRSRLGVEPLHQGLALGACEQCPVRWSRGHCHDRKVRGREIESKGDGSLIKELFLKEPENNKKFSVKIFQEQFRRNVFSGCGGGKILRHGT